MCIFDIIIAHMCMFLFFLLLELNLNSVKFNLVLSNYLLRDWEKGVGDKLESLGQSLAVPYQSKTPGYATGKHYSISWYSS